MKKVLRKSNLTAGVLILVVVCLGIVFAGDVIVKEGDLSAAGTGTFDELTITAPSANSYKFLNRSDDYLALQSQGTGKGNFFELFTKNGSGADLAITLWALGLPGSVTNYESLEMMYDDSEDLYLIKTLAGGTGTRHPFVLDASAGTNQLYLDTNGYIGVGTSTPSVELDVSGDLSATGTIEGVVFKSTGCTATGTGAIAFGYSTEASEPYSTAMGYYTAAIGGYSTAMGYGTTAGGDASTAMGGYTQASGPFSTAMGQSTTASGPSSTAMGWDTTASGGSSTAMGQSTAASGYYSTAMGYWTIASGSFSTAMGLLTTASGDCSTAIGSGGGASGNYSTAIGWGVMAGPADYTTAIGKSFSNTDANSFAVGYGQKDFSVESGEVNVYGDLDVTGSYKANGTAGWSGWFDDHTNFRVYVTNGIITAVTDSGGGGHNP